MSEEEKKYGDEVLRVAYDKINGERQKDYGSPEVNFETIARLWSTYLGKFIYPLDVSNMMILLKVARAMNGEKVTLDTYIDIAGYAGLAPHLIAGKEWEK